MLRGLRGDKAQGLWRLSGLVAQVRTWVHILLFLDFLLKGGTCELLIAIQQLRVDLSGSTSVSNSDPTQRALSIHLLDHLLNRWYSEVSLRMSLLDS
jgi:hypothetical protein